MAMAKFDVMRLTGQMAVVWEVTQIEKHCHPFIIEAMAVFEYLHSIRRLIEGDAGHQIHWSLIKPGFYGWLEKAGVIRASRFSKREYGIWQRRWREHQSETSAILKDMRYNPINNGYAKQPIDWPCSTLYRSVQTGLLLPEHWMNDLAIEALTCGELWIAGLHCIQSNLPGSADGLFNNQGGN